MNDMKVVATIAEFHPFHNGHRYLFEEAMSRCDADFSLAVMGGNFLQRGNVAFWDKYTRANMALQAGIDCILELPFVYATGSAKDFAMGAVCMLNQLQIVDYLAFGVECEDFELMEQLSSILVQEPALFQSTLKAGLTNGNSFPKARMLALEACTNVHLNDILNCPNNILGLEYLCALKRTNSTIKPILIKRTGAGYHDTSLSHGICSASGIRNALSEETSVDELASYLPECIATTLSQMPHRFITKDTLTPFVQSILLRRQSLCDICDLSESLYQKLCKLPVNLSYLQMIEQLHTKDYTQSRVQRAMVHALLGYTQSDRTQFIQANYVLYANLLGFRKKAQSLLSHIKKSCEIPVITKKADFEKKCNTCEHSNPSVAARMWELDCLATDLYLALYYNACGIRLPNDFTVRLPIL